MTECPVIVENIITGERGKGIIIGYKKGSPYKVLLSNIPMKSYWSRVEDTRGFKSQYIFYKPWYKIERYIKTGKNFEVYSEYRIWPLSPSKKQKFKSINL